MKKSNLSTLLNLRLLVGFLGEQGQCQWWPTEFYTAASNSFLLPVFTRTPHLARYFGVIEAAR
ncbi:MAG: BrxE family protein, partial [Acidobacteria bacterium]|nr:BrxE family protein [Acidobacteriota bacterium]